MFRRSFRAIFSPKLIVLAVALILLIASPLFLKFKDQLSVWAQTNCILSPGGPNLPGTCNFSFNYFDRPGTRGGVDNAGVRDCGWQIWSYPTQALIDHCDASNQCTITRQKTAACPNPPTGGNETVSIKIGPTASDDCRQTGSPGCTLWIWSTDNATPRNSGQQYFDFNVQTNRAPSCGTLVGNSVLPSPSPSSSPTPSGSPSPSGSPTPSTSPPPAGTSKLGLQLSCGNQNYWDFIDARPKVVKLMDDYSCAAGIKARSPSTFIVGRIFSGSQPINGNPEQRAQEWFSNNQATITANPSIDCWEGYNEENGDDGSRGEVGGLQWLARFEAERVRSLAGIGRRACIGNFGAGGPTAPEEDAGAAWAAFRPALEAAKANGGYLGLHEYSAPGMQCLFDAGSGEGWLTGRYRKVYRDYLIPNSLSIPLVLTEVGTTALICAQQSACNCGAWAGVGDKGWRIGYSDASTYARELEWYDSLLMADSYVKGATIFISGHSGWSTFETAPELTGANGLLTNYLKGIPGTVTGYSPLFVHFQASGTDPDNDALTEYQWDFDGNSTWDRSTTTGVTDYTYASGGNYCAKVKVKDSQGAWSTNTGSCGTGNTACTESVIVTGDVLPPLTSIFCQGTACSPNWYSGNVSVTLTCSDSGSGCQTTYYCQDQGSVCSPTNVYSGAFNILNDGVSYVRYYSKDYANNSEATQVQSLKIDKLPPTTSIQCNSTACSSNWYNNNVSVALSCSDTGSGCQTTYYCADQSGSCSPVLAGTSFTVSSEGTNYVRYYSKDNANNVGSIQSQSVKVDKTPPGVGKLYLTATQAQQSYPIQIQRARNYDFKADTTDNIQVNNCNLYLPNDQGAMSLSSGTTSRLASKSLSINNKGNHQSYARCQDQALNTTDGTAVEVRVVDLGVSLTATPTSGTPATRFSLQAEVTGEMTGTINYKFDCSSDSIWDLQINGTNTNPYLASNLCQFTNPGTYTAKVFIERGTGSAEVTAQITVSANQPPSPSFSCDASACGPGSSSVNCIGYQGCVLRADNLSSDPNGLEDIQSAAWVVKDKLTGVVKDQLTCSAGNILCNYTIPAILPAKTYNVEITVGDASLATRSYNRDIVIRRDILADFVCSSVNPVLDNTKWQLCNSPTFRPPRGSLVYFHDSLDNNLLSLLGLSGRKSSLSENALRFTRRIWKKDGVPFSVCNSPAGCLNFNPSTIIAGTEITLELEDDSGRSGSANSEITTELPLPEWEEIAPF